MMPKRTILGEGKKSPLNMRTTTAMRDKLEKVAAASGRSLVQEVEFRLEQSFAEERSRAEYAFGAQHTLMLARQIMTTAQLVEIRTGKSWNADPLAAEMLAAAASELIAPMSPEQRENYALADAVRKHGGEEPIGSVGRAIADVVRNPLPIMSGLLGTDTKE